MKPKYRVVKVKAQAIDGGNPDALQACLNECGPNEQILSILPFALEGGYTDSFFVVFGPRT